MKAQTLIKQWLSSPALRLVHVLLIVILGLGVFWWVIDEQLVKADPALIYVRPDGDDIACNGEYNASVAEEPNCAVKTIGQGVLSVTVWGTVSVTIGTYTEDVTVNKAIILQGANPPDGPSAAIVAGSITVTGAGTGTTIRQLRIVPGNVTGNAAAIFVNASNVTIAENLIDGMTGDGTGTIKGVHIYKGNTPAITDTLIISNTIRNIANPPASGGLYGGANGIMVQGVVNGVTLMANTIQTITSAGWAYGIEIAPTASALANPPENVLVQQNHFADVNYGDIYTTDPYTIPYPGVGVIIDAVRNTSGDIIANANASQVTVFGNAISNVPAPLANTDITHTLNASGNYLGYTDVITLAQVISPTLVGRIDYTPWLANDTDTAPGTPGFQGDFSALWVGPHNEQTGAVGRIQEGADMVTTGGTVNVAGGTYRELITVTKSLTLVGASEVFIQPGENIPDSGSNHDGAIIWIQAPDVTIRDVLIDGDNPDIGGGYACGGADINAFRGIYMGGTPGNFDNVLIEHVTLRNLGRGIDLYGGQNHTLRDNVADNLGGPDVENYGYGILLHGDSSAQISNNTFSGIITAIGISSESVAPGVSMTATNNVISDAVIGLSLAGTVPIEHTTFAGNTLNNLTTVFNVSITGELYAYANNITNFASGISDPGQGLINAHHNWWGTHDSRPDDLDDNSWNYRLGAPVEAWGMETLGDAALTSAGGEGTGVIVSHGVDNAPFGRTLVPYVNTPCSDYYDFFVLGAGGAWTVRVPLDATRDECNIADLPFYHFALTPGGWPDDDCIDTACWQTLPGVTRDGDTLAVTVDAEALLQGTPFVAGNGTANLVVSKTNFRTTVYPGETLAYRITITNTGNDAATVSVTDTLPANTSFLVASDGVSDNGTGVVTWPIFNLPGNGASTTRLVVVTLGNPLPAGVDAITNTVTATTPNEEDETDNTAWYVNPVNAAPVLTLGKSDGGADARPGETLVYTLTYANVGNQHATGVVITETVPEHTTFAGSAGWTGSGTTYTHTVGSLPVGNGGSVTFAVTVTTPLEANVTHIHNTATIADDGSNSADLTPVSNTVTLATPVVAAPDLTLSKSDGGVTTTPGATLMYTLTYANVGNQGAIGVVIAETVPAHTTFNATSSSSGWSCTDGALAGTICTNAIGSLPASHSDDRQFAVNVINPVPAGVTQINNTATIADDGSNGADPTPGNNIASTATPVQATPDLEISKSNGVDTVAPGDTLVYTLTVSNTGGQGATGIRITDYLPAHTTFAGASDDGGLYAPGTVTWPLFNLPGGSARVTRTLTVTVANPFPVDTNIITNTATVADDGANGPDPTPVNNTAVDVDTVFAAPILALSKSNDVTTATPGSTLIYRLVITNSGSQLAAGIVLTDTLPDHTAFVSASEGGQETPPGSGVVVWPAFDLPGGASTTRLLVVTVDNPLPAGVTAITNSAELRDNRNNTAEAQDTDAVNANPVLVLEKTNAVDTTVPGATIVYTLTLTNNGNQEATGIRITDTLPDDVTFVTASDGGYTTSPGIVVWPPFDLAGGGASVTRTLTVYVNPTLPAGLEQLINTAQASDDRGYTAFAQHTDRVIATPDLEISKSNGVDTVEPGDTLTYQIVVTNTGSQGATGIRITDYLPAHTTFSSASDGGSLSAPGIVTWPLFNLPGGGASVTRWLTVIVDTPFPVDTNVITNTVTVADDGANGPDPTPENNIAADVDAVFAAPILQLSKSNDVTTVTPGSMLIYRLVITNSGNQLAAGIVVTDTLPEHTSFYLASDNGSESAPGIVVWPPFSLPGGASTTRLLVVTVDNPLPAGVTAITNFAALRDNRDNVAEAQDTDAVDANPLLVLDKTNAVDSTVPGATLVYTLTLTNNGNQEATGILITDTLPADVTFVAASDGGDIASPGIVVWPPFNLAGGGTSVTRTLTVYVNPTLPAGLELLINTAQASDDRGYTAFAQHADLVVAAPDLSITKTDGGVIPRPGDVLVYTLTYANVGNQGATGVVITETVPAYTTFDAAASSPGWTCADDAPDGTLCVYTVGDLPANASNAVVFAARVVNPLPVYVRQTANTASITDDGSNGVDTDPANNTVSIITPFNATIDLFITKDDGGITVEPGETLVYTLTYGNNGDQIAGGVVITEIVPTLTTFNQTASSPGWSCGHGSPAGTTCTYALGDVIEGGSLLFAVDVVLPFPLGVSEISNQVIIGADANNIPDANPNNNIASTITPVITRPDLVAGKDDGFSVVMPDQQLTYVITVTNIGTQNSTDVLITDTLPDHVTFDGASDGGTLSAPGIVTWPLIPQLALDEVVTRTLSVIVNSTLPAGVSHITNTVTVSDDGTHGPDLNPDDNTAIDVNFVGAMPDLVLYKTVDRAIIHPTGLLVYTIRVENTGSQGATGVSIVDTLPTNTNFVSASDGGYESASGVVTWPAFALNVGEQVVRSLTVRTAPALPEDYELTNTATVSDDGANGEDPTPENNTDTAASVIKWPIVYLPVVLRSYAIGPDLIVEDIVVGNGTIAIIIRNQGELAVPDTIGFWVDLYINPSPAPTRVNQTWDSIAPYGAAWAVDREALSSLLPGQSYTLYLYDRYYQPNFSRLPAALRAGDVIYVQVDSFNAATTYGAVLEDHEMGGWEYNNIRRRIIDEPTPLNPVTSMQHAPTSPEAGSIPERP